MGLEKSNSGICVKQIKVLLSSSVTNTFDISGMKCFILRRTRCVRT